VLYKYRDQLEDSEDGDDPSGEDSGLDDDVEGDDEQQAEGEEEEEGAEGEEEEEGAEGEEELEDADDGTTLFCVVCNKRVHRDSFSDRQRNHGTDEDRYCLKHTGTGGFGRSYKRPRPVSDSGSEADEDCEATGREED